MGGLVEEPGQVLAQALAEWLHAFVAAASRLMNLMGRMDIFEGRGVVDWDGWWCSFLCFWKIPSIWKNMKNPSNQYLLNQSIKCRVKSVICFQYAKVRAFQAACSSESTVTYFAMKMVPVARSKLGYPLGLCYVGPCIRQVFFFVGRVGMAMSNQIGNFSSGRKAHSFGRICEAEDDFTALKEIQVSDLRGESKHGMFLFREDLCVIQFYKLFVFRNFRSLRDSLMDV